MSEWNLKQSPGTHTFVLNFSY